MISPKWSNKPRKKIGYKESNTKLREGYSWDDSIKEYADVTNGGQIYIEQPVHFTAS